MNNNKINTKEIEEFIKANNIDSRKKLRKSSTIYQKFCKLSEEEKNKILPKKIIKKYKDLNTVEEFKEFIKENNIDSYKDFMKNYSPVYKRFKQLFPLEMYKLFNTSRTYVKYLNTKEDFKQFIKDNDIISRSDFQDRFQGGYVKFRTLLSEKDRDELLPLKIRDGIYSIYLNNFDDFKKFIEENKILSRSDFNTRFTNGYSKFRAILTEEEKDELLPQLNDFSYLKTVDDFKRFVSDHGIKTRTELSEFDGVYNRFRALTDEEKNEILASTLNDYSNINTKEEFEVFIKENDIISRSDFANRFSRAHTKFCEVLSKEERDSVIFEKDINYMYHHHSFGEVYLTKLFEQNNFKYEVEKTFSDLKNINKLRFDFYLPNYNLVIEYHGQQHFDENNKFYTKDLIFNDKKKYFYCKCNNIFILYFTLSYTVYNRFGYFTEVITDSEILINKIKEIGMTNQPQ